MAFVLRGAVHSSGFSSRIWVFPLRFSNSLRVQLPVLVLEIRCAVAVAGRRPVFGAVARNSLLVLVIVTVIGIVDEVDRDGFRPVGVEDRYCDVSEQEFGCEFEPGPIEGVVPGQHSVITRWLVGFVARLPE